MRGGGVECYYLPLCPSSVITGVVVKVEGRLKDSHPKHNLVDSEDGSVGAVSWTVRHPYDITNTGQYRLYII